MVGGRVVGGLAAAAREAALPSRAHVSERARVCVCVCVCVCADGAGGGGQVRARLLGAGHVQPGPHAPHPSRPHPTPANAPVDQCARRKKLGGRGQRAAHSSIAHAPRADPPPFPSLPSLLRRGPARRLGDSRVASGGSASARGVRRGLSACGGWLLLGLTCGGGGGGVRVWWWVGGWAGGWVVGWGSRTWGCGWRSTAPLATTTATTSPTTRPAQRTRARNHAPNHTHTRQSRRRPGTRKGLGELQARGMPVH